MSLEDHFITCKQDQTYLIFDCLHYSSHGTQQRQRRLLHIIGHHEAVATWVSGEVVNEATKIINQCMDLEIAACTHTHTIDDLGMAKLTSSSSVLGGEDGGAPSVLTGGGGACRQKNIVCV